MILGLPDLKGVYDAGGAGGGAFALTVLGGAFAPDGAALAAGATGTAGPDYMNITRGALSVLATAFNATDNRTTIYSTAINGIDLSPDPAVIPDEAIISLTPSHLQFLRQDRTFLSNAFTNLFALQAILTLDFTPATMGAFVLFAPTIRYRDVVSGFGMGLLFNAGGIFENDPSVAINLTTGLSYVGQNIYRANAQTITMLQLLDFLSQPRFQILAGGVLTVTQTIRHFTSRGTLAAGVTVSGDRIGFNAGLLSVFTGTLTGVNVGFQVDNLVSGAGGAVGLRSTMASGALRFFIEHTGSAASLFGGDVEIDGALNHDGSTAGFLGATPVVRPPAYSITNATPSRTLNVSTVTLTILANVVAQLLQDGGDVVGHGLLDTNI